MVDFFHHFKILLNNLILRKLILLFAAKIDGQNLFAEPEFISDSTPKTEEKPKRFTGMNLARHVERHWEFVTAIDSDEQLNQILFDNAVKRNCYSC